MPEPALVPPSAEPATTPAPHTFVALGIDPGLRATGIAAVERFPDASYRTRGVRVSWTEPTKEQAFSRFRSSADESRRLRDHWAQITEAIHLLKPQVIGIENYSVFEPVDVNKLRQASDAVVGLFGGAGTLASLSPADLVGLFHNTEAVGRLLGLLQQLATTLHGPHRDRGGLGHAAKTIAVYGAALGAAFASGVPVFVFEPADRTRRIGGRKGASKEDIGGAVYARVHGLQEQVEQKITRKDRREHAWDAAALAILAAEEYVQLRLDAGASH